MEIVLTFAVLWVALLTLYLGAVMKSNYDLEQRVAYLEKYLSIKEKKEKE